MERPVPLWLPSGNPPGCLRDVRRWNWGAFFLTWIWAFAHRLSNWGIAGILSWFVPLPIIAPLGFAIYLGVRGSELAWSARPFESVEHFRRTERVWAWWGFGVFIAFVLLVCLVLWLFPFIVLALLVLGHGPSHADHAPVF